MVCPSVQREEAVGGDWLGVMCPGVQREEAGRGGWLGVMCPGVQREEAGRGGCLDVMCPGLWPLLCCLTAESEWQRSISSHCL